MRVFLGASVSLKIFWTTFSFSFSAPSRQALFCFSAQNLRSPGSWCQKVSAKVTTCPSFPSGLGTSSAITETVPGKPKWLVILSLILHLGSQFPERLLSIPLPSASTPRTSYSSCLRVAPPSSQGTFGSQKPASSLVKHTHMHACSFTIVPQAVMSQRPYKVSARIAFDR